MLIRSPCQENVPADAHTSAHKSVLESANPAWTQSVHLDAPGQRHGQQPVSGTADPGVVKQDKSSRGTVDMTKTRSDPQRVGMCSGERPIGATKGKQIKTMTSCQPSPPPPPWGAGGGGGDGAVTLHKKLRPKPQTPLAVVTHMISVSETSLVLQDSHVPLSPTTGSLSPPPPP